MKFSQDELDVILDLCNKKLKGVNWVLKEKSNKLKENKKSDLEEKRDKLESLINKISAV